MIGTLLGLDLPAISDTMETMVAKTRQCLSDIQDSIADQATQAAINIAGDFDVNGNKITNVNAVTLANGAAPTAPGSIYYHSGEFYAIDATGAIQLTLAGALNAASIKGIGGDYGGVNPALASFVEASSIFKFEENGTTHTMAGLEAGSLKLDGATSGSVTVISPASPTTYTLTLPSAVPASIATVKMSPAGVLTAALDARQLIVPVGIAIDNSSGTKAGYQLTLGTGTAGSFWPIAGLSVGDIITGYTVYANKNTGSGNTLVSALYSEAAYGTSSGSLEGSVNNSANNPGDITLVVTGLTVTVAVNKQYAVVVSPSTATAGDIVYHVVVNYTRG